MDLSKMNNNEVIALYSDIIKELKKREIIRTKNVLGELSEYVTIDCYNKNPTLPKLQAAPVGSRNVDALSKNGGRYTIKSTSTNVTGVFTGLDFGKDEFPNKQFFEYVVICKFDDEYRRLNIYQLDWNLFLKHKSWHSRMKGWNLVITKELIND